MAAAEVLPLIEPFADEVAFNGATSQGPVAAYVGKLASLLGRHEQAEDHLRDALVTATSFGWAYHRATTLFALAQVRHRRDGQLDKEGAAWLREAGELCRAGGFQRLDGPKSTRSSAPRAHRRRPERCPRRHGAGSTVRTGFFLVGRARGAR